MTLREYIYIREEVCIQVRVYRRGVRISQGGFRIMIGADGSEGYFLLGSF